MPKFLNGLIKFKIKKKWVIGIILSFNSVLIGDWKQGFFYFCNTRAT